MLDKLNVIKFLEKYTYYPKEYNPRVHGPFVHYRNYGKPDIPFSEVKVGEIGSWLARRDMSLYGMRGLFRRALGRYHLKYLGANKTNAAVLYHLMFFGFAYGYFAYEYDERKKHKWAIYH